MAGSVEVGSVTNVVLELTVDILTDGWAEVPIGLGEVAVDKVSIADSADQ